MRVRPVPRWPSGGCRAEGRPQAARRSDLEFVEKLKPEKFVSHRFTFDSLMEAYDTFGRAAGTKALKVAITR